MSRRQVDPALWRRPDARTAPRHVDPAADESPLALRTEGAPSAPDIRLALAVGPGTASAAEVLAGALQRNGRARIYGTRTFGKGLVHQALPLEEGRWVLMLPAGQIELSDGRRILRNGIDPDVRTVNPVEQALRDLSREHPAGG